MEKVKTANALKRVSEHPNQRPTLLPQNLDASLRYLSNEDLERLAAAVAAQQRSRGLPTVEAIPKSEGAKRATASRGEKRGQALTAPQVSLIKAAIKAGVKPPALARQFGITKDQIEAALSNS